MSKRSSTDLEPLDFLKQNSVMQSRSPAGSNDLSALSASLPPEKKTGSSKKSSSSSSHYDLN
jgi:hypothetical protein